MSLKTISAILSLETPPFINEDGKLLATSTGGATNPTYNVSDHVINIGKAFDNSINTLCKKENIAVIFENN